MSHTFPATQPAQLAGGFHAQSAIRNPQPAIAS
jgi:hypothetical protein